MDAKMIEIVYLIANTGASISRSALENTSSLNINVNSSTDWNLIFATIFLGICALLVPFIERIERFIDRPKLNFSFRLAPPDCHLTKRMITRGTQISFEPVYYFRLKIDNTEGKSQARKCEVVLEKISVVEDAIESEVPNFPPGNLIWVGTKEQYIDINPRRSVFCDIGHIASRQYQLTEELDQRVSLPGYRRDDLCFMLELLHHFKAQPNCLHRGKYILDIGVYSENAAYQKARFEISWSGEWKNSETEMFSGSGQPGGEINIIKLSNDDHPQISERCLLFCSRYVCPLRPDRIIWILDNNGGHMDKNTLQRCIGMSDALLDPTLDELAREGKIRIIGEIVTLL